MSLSTMRVSRPTSFFGKEEHIAVARRIRLQRFEGQEKALGGVVRLPQTALVPSRAGPNSGMGLELREDVRKNQIIAIYHRNIISEQEAAILKEQVWQYRFRQSNINFIRPLFTLDLCRAIGTFVIITTLAAA